MIKLTLKLVLCILFHSYGGTALSVNRTEVQFILFYGPFLNIDNFLRLIKLNS